MKKLKFTMVLFAMMALPLLGLSDVPPPPPPGGGGPGGGGTPVGAPLDGGLGILLALGIAYGGKKLHHIRKPNDAGLTKPENQ
jgi:hypothetical protein